jgi:high-affinity iron transporter
MFAATLITLRETLEASLVVGIILAYLDRAHEGRHTTAVWFGVFCGMALSFCMAVLLRILLGDLTGEAQEIYEAVTMLVAAGMLTWMIVWMLKQRRSVRGEIEGKVSEHLAVGHIAGLFALALFSTAREALETVLFLNALLVHSQAGLQVFGGVAGIAIAIGLSYFLFRGIEIVPLKKCFSVTSVLLILFAAGLIAHGIHEMQVNLPVSFFTRPLWSLQSLAAVPGLHAILHEDGVIGGILHSLFGYSTDPTPLELMGYAGYLLGIRLLWLRMRRPTA